MATLKIRLLLSLTYLTFWGVPHLYRASVALKKRPIMAREILSRPCWDAPITGKAVPSILTYKRTVELVAIWKAGASAAAVRRSTSSVSQRCCIRLGRAFGQELNRGDKLTSLAPIFGRRLDGATSNPQSVDQFQATFGRIVQWDYMHAGDIREGPDIA